MSEQEWSIEHRKHGNEVYVVSSREGIFVGEGYNDEERKRSHFLADIIVEALNKAENKQQDEKNREGWTCIHCGESTYDNDYEQLFSAIEHIECGLKAEREAKKKNKESLID
jgi:hypothetical protein